MHLFDKIFVSLLAGNVSNSIGLKAIKLIEHYKENTKENEHHKI